MLSQGTLHSEVDRNPTVPTVSNHSGDSGEEKLPLNRKKPVAEVMHI